jgi:hypothetical protein
MKKCLFTALLFSSIFSISSSAQNLVLNPGLENIITCPPGMGVFSSAYISNWSKPTIGSTDYYSYNCLGLEPIPAPHGGASCFGIYSYNYSGEYREYATAQLSTSLVGGVQYSVEFYVLLLGGYIQAIHELGAYLSATAPGPFSNSLHIAVTPQVENTTLLSSYTTWMLVSGTFVAAGGEQYITIGNFNDDANTTVVQVSSVGSYGAYYFVDDVSVMELPTGMDEITSTSFSIFPSSATNFVNIKSNIPSPIEATVFSSMGNVIFKTTLAKEGTETINVSGWAAGIYLVAVKSEKDFVVRKIIKE